MTFETLRLMAQDYADRHKEPPPLPATIDTMAYTYQRICQGEDPWTALGDFSNAWYGYAKHIRPDLVKEPLIKPEQETEGRRNIFCSNRLYQNKYEMYEWIQEAIVKGITDVHEIQRYARQKEISLYGA